MTLQIIGSGFGRTGTRSLKDALELLGFGPCHHMEEVFGHPEQVHFWQDHAADRPVDWNQVFAGYGAQVDWPGAAVWRQTAEVFPGAKVLHSVRPEEAWWASFSRTIGKLMRVRESLSLPPHLSAMLEATTSFIFRDTFGGGPIDHDTAIAAFRRRTADVVATIPPERLLVYDVAEGWEPLCAFLSVPVPDAPFPNRNHRTDFWANLGGEPPD